MPNSSDSIKRPAANATAAPTIVPATATRAPCRTIIATTSPGLALGASPGEVVAMIVRQGALVAVAGTIVGAAVAFAAGRLIESLLFGIGSRDPAIFGATTALLLAIAVAACWLPARRAARLNPLDALRAD